MAGNLKPLPPGRICGLSEGPLEEEGGVCGQPAVAHIAWKDVDPIHSSFSCKEHLFVAVTQGPFLYHELGPCCGMPEAHWYVLDNYCGYEDGLPVQEKKQANHKESIK